MGSEPPSISLPFGPERDLIHGWRSRPEMPTFVALLRAVNLGGDSQVKMSSLCDVVSRLGYQDVRTLLQSGNLVFRGGRETPRELEQRLETEVGQRLGLRTDFFVRSNEEWNSIIQRNPFPKEAQADPSHLVVTVLRAAPPKERWAALDEAIRGRERVRGSGREAYIVYPDGIGRSKLTARLIETSLGTRGTSRNWNTVTKLGAMVAGR